jgi:hypothetical protein
VVVIHRKRWSPSTGNHGRHGPARAVMNLIPPIFVTAALLAVFLFAAEA